MRLAARPHGGGPSSMSLLSVPVHPLQTNYVGLEVGNAENAF